MSLNAITPTTELEALNKVLSCLLEAPVESTTSDQPDVQTALAVLEETSREVQSENWRYNTQFGYRLTSTATYVWDGDTLNVFVLPSNALRAEPAKASNPAYFVERQAERYENPASVKPKILFDLALGRDGWADRSVLEIDVVWAFSFVSLPECIRRYITIKAARRFAGTILGNPNRSGFLIEDERMAWRECIRSQKPAGRGKILNPRELIEANGGRRMTIGYDADAIRYS